MENREIPKGWKQGLLKDLCIKIGSGSTPRGGSEVYKKEGISLIRSQNILDFAFSYDGLAFIDEEQAKKLNNVEIEEEDVLINITGDSVARVCMVPSVTLPARVNQHVAILRVNKKILNPYYLKYYLLNPNFKKHLLLLANSGGTRNALTKLSLESLEILHPSYEEQVAIGQVLSSLDEKRELLEEENKTLETLAQTIFTEWFVNFNFPGATGEMEDSDIGQIPKGWRVGKLGEITTVKSGFAFKSNDFVDESNFKALKIKDLKGKGNVDVSNLSCVSEEITQLDRVKYFKLSGGDIVVAMSGNTTGKIGILPETSLEIYLNQRVGKFFVENRSINNFLYTFLMTNNYEDKILSMSYGSAQPNISPALIENIKLVLPSQDIFNKFLELINPIFYKISANKTQIETLKLTRDTLLPDLTSGKIRVKGFGE